MSNDKVADVAKKIIWAFKSRLTMSPGCSLLKKIEKDSYVEVGEEEALKMIKAQLHNRNQSSKSWRVGMPDAKIAAFEQPAPKAKQVNEGLESPSTKKQKTMESRHEDKLPVASKPKFATPYASSSNRSTRNSAGSPSTVTNVFSTCYDDPLTYVGNHIANLLTKEEGWSNVNKKIDSINCGQVIYRAGCDKKTAVEGVDKFIGYAALARWAYESGYYKEKVVNDINGKGQKVLEKADLSDDPYSIFRDAEDEKPAAQPQPPVQADQHPIQQARGRVSPPTKIKDDEPPVLNDGGNNMLSFSCSNDNQDYWQIHESIDTKFDVATAENNEESVGFYRYLLSYLDGKATRGEFSLAPAEKDSITKAVKSFEDTKEKYEKAILANKPADAYKFWMINIVNTCKQKLPLA